MKQHVSMDVVTGAVGSLISKLGELLTNEYKLLKSVPEEIESLIKELECAHAALCKVSKVPPAELDEQVKLWARELREASYDMDDVIDTFLVNEGGHETSDQEGLLQRLLDKAVGLVSIVRNQFKRRKIAGTINDINKRINEVTHRYGRYTADNIALARPAARVDPRLAAMYKEVSQLIGINKSSSELISMLSPQGDDEFKRKMKMVSVVGVGGLGKTTLAKAVYDKLKEGVDGRMVSAFVPVGRDPDLKKVFRDVLVELDKSKYMDLKITMLDERQLINELRDHLRDRRYLVVIDDIWDACSWETIKLAFVDNKHGSRLITTTRHLDVATKTGEVYKLQPLSSDKSKKLFYTRVFGAKGGRFDDQPDELLDKILKKCNGIPLAIITMASLLAGKSREDWIKVCSSIAFADKDNQQASDTEWILSLSYYDMPSHLKTCLLSLSAFPEDYFIHKDRLIWKWVAEGFVDSKSGTRMFELGEGYFNDLINRSMMMAELREGGIIYGCRIHDMVLDLLRVKAQEENFVTISGTNAEDTSSPGKVRRLVHQNGTVEQTHQDTQMDMQRVRTFIACRCIIHPGLSFMSFKLLRVLALEDCGGWQQNPPIGLKHLESLLHLRYLGLRKTCIYKLPDEIGSLKYLQTLDLEQTRVEKLPYSVGLLTQLICLLAFNTELPNGVIDKLTSLEELHVYVRVGSAGQFMKDLGKLRELRVLVLCFYFDMNVIMQSDFVESIGNLHKIRHVKLNTNGIQPDQTVWNTAVLPRPLRFLSIREIMFRTMPSCINPLVLTNLAYLELNVRDLDERGLQILGRLPELRFLFLRTDSSVTLTIQAADDCFQKLTYLILPLLMPQFAVNEDSSVSFTIWNRKDDMAFGSKTGDKCIVAPTVMQNLQVLDFFVGVQDLLRNSGSCENLGLEYLPSLKKVRLDLWDYDGADDMEKEKAALRHAIEAHPSRPTLQISCLTKEHIECPQVDHDLATDEQEDVVSSTAYEDVAMSRGEGDPSTSYISH